MSQSLKLPFSIYAISIIGFFFAFSFQMITPILPIYSVNNVGANLGEVAAIVAFGFSASAISKLTTGMLVKVKGALMILLVGLIFFTICNYLYLIVQNPQHLMIVRFLHGMSFGIIITLILSLATFLSGKGFRGRSIGLYTGLIASGLMAGPAVGSIIISFWGLESVFLTLFFVGLIPIILSLHLNVSLRLNPDDLNEYKNIRMFREIFSNQTILICFFTYLIYAIFYGTLMAYIPVYLNRNFEIPAQTVSSIFFCFFLLASIIRFRLDRVVRKIGDKGGVIFGFTNYIFFTTLLFMMPEKYLTITSIIFMGISHGIIFPLLAIRISRSIPYEHLILANSLYLISFDAGSIIGPTTTSILAYYSIPLALSASLLPALAILPILIYKT